MPGRGGLRKVKSAFSSYRHLGPVVQPGMPIDGAEERPVRKALPEEPEGRGSESRPVHHIYRLRFPSFGRFLLERFGSEA